jgi:hypothetical protein
MRCSPAWKSIPIATAQLQSVADTRPQYSSKVNITTVVQQLFPSAQRKATSPGGSSILADNSTAGLGKYFLLISA